MQGLAAVYHVAVGLVIFLWPGACSGFTDRPLWQAKCMQSQHCIPEYNCNRLANPEGNRDGVWPICADGLSIGNCIVYSFGIANDWSFDTSMGQIGCEVHSFDPSVQLPEQLAPNVTFHPWGLKGKRTEGAFSKAAETSYGPQLGELFTLQEIRHRLGHTGPLSVLKIDCEGCEWAFFSEFRKNPVVLPDQIALELHFSQTFGFTSPRSFSVVSDAFEILSQAAYERFFWQENEGFEHDQPMAPSAVAAGFPPNICCREMVFKRRLDKTPSASLTKAGSHSVVFENRPQNLAFDE